MNMNINITAPLSWNELSLRDLKHVAQVMMLPEIDRTHASILLFCKLAGLKMKKNIENTVFFKMGKQSFVLEPYQLMDFSKKMDFIFEEKPCDIVNPTKIDSHLIDVKFGDYYFANAMMMRYQYTGDKKFVRQALKALGQRTIYLSKMKGMMIWIWWTGVQSYLQDLYPLVFPKSEGESDKTSYQVLQDIFLMLNDNKPQDNKEIAKAELHSVLSALQNKIEQYNREREALKK